MKNKFAKRVTELAKMLLPESKNKQVSLAELTGEKESTVRNWLFNDKKPSASKRLRISDSLGVSICYLFNDGDFSYPVTVYDKNTDSYSVPEIDEINLFQRFTKNNYPVVVYNRNNVNISCNITNNVERIDETYCFKSNSLEFNPFISKGDIVFINLTANKINGLFTII
ncbi:helix-turn-helix domain-containing protein, partial [Photobacterium phosphoreum]|uniref:helix-turn-helix domain-containing protein n=1 Tax=Photobacterium phosphoreum TaxID=659 RepID=UPI0011B1E677